MNYGFEMFMRKVISKNLSKPTLTQYEGSYKYFCQYLKQQYNVDEIQSQDIDEEHIFGFSEYVIQKNKDIKATTINYYIRGIRAFFTI